MKSKVESSWSLKMKNSAQLLFSSFLLLPLILFLGGSVMAQNTTVSFNVGVVLDFDTWVGKMGLSCIPMALSDFYAAHSFYKTRLVLHTRDSKKDVVGAASAALDLLKNVEVQAIIGPETSAQANFVLDLGDKAQVPIVSFSATSPSLSSKQNSYFIRAAQNDSSQVKAISAIVQAFGWREAVPIYEDTDYGNGVIPYLTDAFQEIDTRVPYRSVISPSATDDEILAELYKLMTMQTRVFIVHMSRSLCSRFFPKVKEVGMMDEGYVWIITDGLTNLLNSMDPTVIDSMQGVLGLRTYVPKSKDLDNFTARWRKKLQQNHTDFERSGLNIFGLWAYDSVWALAKAAEKIGGTTISFQNPEVAENTTDLAAIGVSQIGPKLLQAVLRTRFRGLSGEFNLLHGQLQSTVFELVNVIGNGAREIGFWTPLNGIVRELNANGMNKYTTSISNLRAIIWPGESTTAPKGWVIPTSGKKLRIGVPVKDGFSEFVKVTRDPSTNVTTVTGYCIDVFDAVMKALPYAVPYEYIPFANSDGKSAGTYNDLVYQVFLQNYDAAVGDTTIIANRSQYVDFTLPYTESGVSMIVPVKDDERKNAWIFLKPLSRNLWLTSGAFFIYTGFVIWVLEHRINDDFRGPLGHQLGTIFWFSFSTLVFAHRERVMSNLARFAVIIWIFVVLILTSSYTASLTSMLTVQQLRPTVTDIKELIKNGENVGYQQGSFVLGLLKRLNFDESKLKVYNSPEEFEAAFSKGSKNGGIAAAFDEIPYIKLLLSRYCSKYTMVEPTYKTDGFGFVFPRGSPLVPDVSRAVLNVTEGDKMVEIEQAWFGHQTSCPDPSTLVSSNSLTLDSFWGLFLIAGVSSFLAFFIYSTIFLYQHGHILTRADPDTSIWQRIVNMARHFDRKDLSSHTFRNIDYQDRANCMNINGGVRDIDYQDRANRMNVNGGVRDIDYQDRANRGVDASPRTNHPSSPSVVSIRTNENTSVEYQGMSSTEFAEPNPDRSISQGIVPSIELNNLNRSDHPPAM